jgi:hypothetical protein
MTSKKLVVRLRSVRPREIALAVLMVGAMLGIATPACTSDDLASGLAASQACSLNSDCAAGLKCALGRCRSECVASADCGNGGSCISDGTSGVCQLAAEKNTPCDKQSDCSAPLACASDYRCRNLCKTVADCNVLGISGRLCAKDSAGVFFCAEPSEVSNDGTTIVAPPPPGAPSTPVDGPGQDMDASRDGDSSSSMNEGGSETGGGVVCSPACGLKEQCISGVCTPCGDKGIACCGTSCSSNLSCVGGTCACGAPGTACCGGTTCANNGTCTGGKCVCGESAEACCPQAVGPSTCNGTLSCAGLKCTCIKAIDGSLVQKGDGSLWFLNAGTPTPITKDDGTKFIATSFADGGTFGCGVQGGSVWCFNYPNDPNGNGYGRLGNGTNPPTGSIYPVQVVTSAGGAALTNMVSVFAGFYGGFAADASGNLWSWGYGTPGVLGNGFTNDSSFAVPVLTAAGGAQFSGVASVARGSSTACARKTTGTLWCWGSNSSGQVGVGTSQATYLYPTQVADLFDKVVNVSVGDRVTCATTTDGKVWCWGSNANGELGNGLSSGASLTPQTVKVSDGGPDFTGADFVLAGSSYAQTVLRKKADGSLWWWGGGTTSNVPIPYTEMNFAVDKAFLLSRTPYPAPEFIAADGTIHQGGAAAAFSCP